MRILRIGEVVRKTGLCRASIYAQIAQGRFPPQLKLTANAVGWRESEVDEWIRQLERADSSDTAA